MVHFSQSLMPDIPLATSLPTTFTFQPNHNQLDEQSALQQQSVASSSQSHSSSSTQQRSSSNDESTNNNQTHTNDYETRLRCPNCDTWVVNLSDHLRKTHRIASPVDRKPLLRMARLEKRRMTESANNSSTTNRRPPETVVVNGLQPSHTNTNNEIENLLFKQEQDPTPQFSVTLPENILLSHQITNSIAHFSTPIINKRPRASDDHIEHTMNGPLSPNKKTRLDIIDASKLPQTNHSSSGKSSKKNRNKQQQQQQQQQQPQPQTIIKTSASGIFPQQTVALQHIDESSDDLSKVLQMMGNEMNFLNQHLQTTSILLQKQLDLARDSLHACSVQFAHLKRMIQQQI
ncbi:unnamed protein product [Rotaria socialis]|uniref:Uncharacterized protein n=1 Tax=Rotaria socialis TaxID=392032 RepID=A0A818HWH6_9BILA|nr:unnamed protein product [Rotaria socialis]CAF4454558.1 unnamed protein product [Rotaria socialis]